jgi:dimethylhistidine N-methyltransferase
MDLERLSAIPRIKATARRFQRIQRKVHVQPNGLARGILRDSEKSYPRDLPKLLSTRSTLAVQRNQACPMIYLDLGAEAEDFSTAVARGLRCSPKRISPKYFYDPRGSELFEEICQQPEYYPTRTETLILHQNIREISSALGIASGTDSMLIEFGSGASVKTQILLDHLKFRTYVPFDISKSFLLKTAEQLQARYPEMTIIPACGDFAQELRIPSFVLRKSQARLAFLPGSTLGNFDPIEAAKVLRSIRAILGTGHLLIGLDLIKDPTVLELAYNDAAGITAEFNKNLLRRLREETGANLRCDAFEHRAFFNEKLGRIEMHLVAQEKVQFRIGDEIFALDPGESIHTENSYKYKPSVFQRLCADCGFEPVRFWTDPKEWFGVFLLRADSPEARVAHVA